MEFIVDRSFNVLSWIDYLVLGISLGMSAMIGIFFAWKDRNSSSNEYLMGNRSLPTIPVALSLTTSFISAVTVLGTPVEFYAYGTMYSMLLLFLGRMDWV